MENNDNIETDFIVNEFDEIFLQIKWNKYTMFVPMNKRISKFAIEDINKILRGEN